MVNKVILIGNVGADPEVRQTSGGTSVCELRLATNESYKDKDGQRVDKTEWHRVIVWGVTAENVGRYVSKGSKIYVEGKIQTREWEDKEGQKRYTTEIVASQVTFLDSKRDSGNSDASFGGGSSAAPAKRQATAAQFNDSDIPF